MKIGIDNALSSNRVGKGNKIMFEKNSSENTVDEDIEHCPKENRLLILYSYVN